MTDSNVVKIQVELHKEIKKNGNPRPLRAALWRFAELCHLIRYEQETFFLCSNAFVLEKCWLEDMHSSCRQCTIFSGRDHVVLNDVRMIVNCVIQEISRRWLWYIFTHTHVIWLEDVMTKIGSESSGQDMNL
jgi:hypothetical protein